MLHIDGSCVDLEGEGREGTGRVHGACMQADMQWGKLVQQPAAVCRHPPTHSLEHMVFNHRTGMSVQYGITCLTVPCKRASKSNYYHALLPQFVLFVLLTEVQKVAICALSSLQLPNDLPARIFHIVMALNSVVKHSITVPYSEIPQTYG